MINLPHDHVAVCAILGVKRTKVFGLWRSGELASIKIGRRRFSTDRQIAEYIGRLEAAA